MFNKVEMEFEANTKHAIHQVNKATCSEMADGTDVSLLSASSLPFPTMSKLGTALSALFLILCMVYAFAIAKTSTTG